MLFKDGRGLMDSLGFYKRRHEPLRRTPPPGFDPGPRRLWRPCASLKVQTFKKTDEEFLKCSHSESSVFWLKLKPAEAHGKTNSTFTATNEMMQAGKTQREQIIQTSKHLHPHICNII